MSRDPRGPTAPAPPDGRACQGARPARTSSPMKIFCRSLACAAILTTVGLGPGASSASAQGFTFGLSSPGLSVGVASGYPAVAPPPVVVTPPPVVVTPPPVVVTPPYVVGRPFYPGYYGGYRHRHRHHHHHPYYRY